LGLTLYFLRHGQTNFSQDNSFAGSGLDLELTSKGVEMAHAFAAAYAATPWQAIYCSPMRRTRATVQPLCTAIGQEIEIRDGLTELSFGRWEGLTQPEAQQATPDEYLRWSIEPGWYPPPNGETAHQVIRRAIPVIEEIMQHFDDGNILIVSHKSTIRITLCRLLGLDVGLYRHRLDCPVASLSIVEFRPQGPMLRLLADQSHLPARLRSWE
jgi:probable phosphoglycerate mutase